MQTESGSSSAPAREHLAVLPRERRRLWALTVLGSLSLVYLLTEPPRPGQIPTDYSPNSLLPMAILNHHTFDLRAYDALLQSRSDSGVVRALGHHLVSSYPIGASLTALPFYVPDHFSGAPVTRERAEYLGHLAAAILTAGSAALVLLILFDWVAPPWAFFLTLVYGLGTCALSITNKALWQHGPAAFWIALSFYVSTGNRRQRGGSSLFSGFALGMAVLCRPTNLPFVLAAIAERLVRREGRPAVLVGMGALPVALLNLAYNIHFLGGPLIFGGDSGYNVREHLIPNFGRLLALCGSPGRGLFLFLPFLTLLPVAVWFGGRVIKQPDYGHLVSMLMGSLASLLITSGWHVWWGGYSYGPRLVSDFTPVLVLALAPLAGSEHYKRLWGRLLIVLGSLSIAIHTLGAVVPGRPDYWDAIYMPNGLDDATNLWRWRTAPIPFYAKSWWRAERHKRAPNAGAVDGCAGSLWLDQPLTRMPRGPDTLLWITAQNRGKNLWWNVAGGSGALGEMHLTYRWLAPDGTTEVGDGSRTILWDDVRPGETISMPMRVIAPETAGAHVLRLTLVSEGVRWCDQEGGALLDIPVQVE